MQRAALIALAFAVTPCLAAEAYPARNVRLVAPFAPGGTNDAVARVIVQQLAERLGKSFIVEKRAGEGGVLANDIVAKAAPDGRMLLVTNPAFAMAVALYQSLPYDTLQSFTPVPEIMRAPNVLVIKPALSAKSLAEFIALARASVPYQVLASKPGTAESATVGIGGSVGQRCGLLMPSVRSLPLRTYGSVPDTEPNITWMCPPSRSMSASPVRNP